MIVGGKVTALVGFKSKQLSYKVVGLQLQFPNVLHIVLGKSGSVLCKYVWENFCYLFHELCTSIKLMELHTTNAGNKCYPRHCHWPLQGPGSDGVCISALSVRLPVCISAKRAHAVENSNCMKELSCKDLYG